MRDILSPQMPQSSEDVFENFYKQHLSRRLLTGKDQWKEYDRDETPESGTG